MKAKRLALVVLFCVVVLVALLVAATAASASDAERAQFGVTARGDCLVDLADDEVYPEREYVEVANGLVTLHGEGLIKTATQFKMVPVYELESTSLAMGGSVRAEWTHGGVSYGFQAHLYAASDTPTLVGREGYDNVIAGISLDQDWMLSRYSGTWTVGGVRIRLDGYCCLAAGSSVDNSVVTLKFAIPGYLPFGLTWAKEAGVVDLWGPYSSPFDCPAAEALDYWVKAH